jgi:hypothetical protein
MKRRLTLVGMATLGALAFTVPANAVELAYPTGIRLATGNTLEAQNVGEARATGGSGSSLWSCNTASVTGALVKNGGGTVEADLESLSFSGTAAEGRCTSSFGNLKITAGVENGLPWCLRSTPVMAPDEFQLRGGKCSEAARQIRIVVDSSAIGECKYSRGSAIAGTFSTHPDDAVLTISAIEFVKDGGGFFCPSSKWIDLSLTLERDEAGTNPVYLTVPPTPELTFPTGTRLASGSTLEGQNVAASRATDGSSNMLWECAAASVTGMLAKNNGSEIEANLEYVSFSGTGSESECTATFGNLKVTTAIENGVPWCIKASSSLADEFTLRGGKCSEASRPIRIVADSTTVGECKYKREAAISGTFTTHPEDAVFTISAAEFVKEAGSFFCPSMVRLDLSFTPEKDEAGTNPIYIS